MDAIGRKDEQLGHVLGREGRKGWREVFEKRIWNLESIIEIQRLVLCEDIENRHKIWVYTSKYKEK